jgi:hypothetical protein
MTPENKENIMVAQSPEAQECPNNRLENPQITSPEDLPGLIQGLPRSFLRTVTTLYKRPQETTEEEMAAARVNLPERPNRSKERTPYLPGRKLKTRGDKLRARNGLLVRESRAKAIREAVFCLINETPTEKSISRAAKKILRRKEQGNEKSEAKARSRVRKDLRWFLKHLRPYQGNRVYQVLSQEEDKQEVNTMFKNPEWQKTYQAVLTHFGSLSVYEFMLQLNDLLPKGYSYL